MCVISLYKTPSYALDLGPIALEREVVRRLTEGVLSVQKIVPDAAVPPTAAEVKESGDEVCEQKTLCTLFTDVRGCDFKNIFSYIPQMAQYKKNASSQPSPIKYSRCLS